MCQTLDTLFEWCCLRGFTLFESMFEWVLWVEEHPNEYHEQGFSTETLCCCHNKCHTLDLLVGLMLWLLGINSYVVTDLIFDQSKFKNKEEFVLFLLKQQCVILILDLQQRVVNCAVPFVTKGNFGWLMKYFLKVPYYALFSWPIFFFILSPSLHVKGTTKHQLL